MASDSSLENSTVSDNMTQSKSNEMDAIDTRMPDGELSPEDSKAKRDINFGCFRSEKTSEVFKKLLNERQPLLKLSDKIRHQKKITLIQHVYWMLIKQTLSPDNYKALNGKHGDQTQNI